VSHLKLMQRAAQTPLSQIAPDGGDVLVDRTLGVLRELWD
jgi:hypothetical protein